MTNISSGLGITQTIASAHFISTKRTEDIKCGHKQNLGKLHSHICQRQWIQRCTRCPPRSWDPHFSSLFEVSMLSFIFCFCIRVRVEVISASFCWNLDSPGRCLLPSASSDPSISKRSFFSGLGGLLPSALLLSTRSLLHTIWFIFWNFSEVYKLHNSLL